MLWNFVPRRQNARKAWFSIFIFSHSIQHNSTHYGPCYYPFFVHWDMNKVHDPSQKKKEDEQTYIRWAKKLTKYQTWATWFMRYSSILPLTFVSQRLSKPTSVGPLRNYREKDDRSLTAISADILLEPQSRLTLLRWNRLTAMLLCTFVTNAKVELWHNARTKGSYSVVLC